MGSKILLVEDDKPLAALLADELRAAGHTPVVESTGEAAVQAVKSGAIDVVVTDVHLAGHLQGTDVCAQLKGADPDLPIIVITAHGTMEVAIRALRAGADDLLVKPFEGELLLHAIAQAEKGSRLVREVRALRHAVDAPALVGDVLGNSTALRRALELVRRAADSDVTVLVTGESGTGKELAARALHTAGARRGNPFVLLHCASLPEAALESELFGHVRGAFLEARADHPGLFLEAGDGTIFLDEVGELPAALQPKLLRALEERTVVPVGGSQPQPFRARVVAATHRDLRAAAEAGEYRRDLYDQLSIVEVALPPLRDRGNDVPLLAQHFLTSYSARMRKAPVGLSPRAAQLLLAYDWPGNVRELANCMERAVALAQTNTLLDDDLPARITAHRPQQLVIDVQSTATMPKLAEIERRYILQVYEACHREKKKTAQVLGVDRKTLYRKLEEYGLWKGGPE